MADTKKVLLYIGVGCGGFLVVVVALVVALFFYGKHKMEQAGGPKAFAAQMMLVGINAGVAPQAIAVLPEGERDAARQTLKDLEAKSKSFDDKDIQALSAAMNRLTADIKQQPNRVPSLTEAQAFFAECKRIVDRH